MSKSVRSTSTGGFEMNSPLFTPWNLGGINLPNRVVMAPMTRSRANAQGAPDALTATYYAQRATAGLIFTEANNISVEANSGINTMGLYSDAQTAGWRDVVDAVHAAGGRIIAQLGHA